MKTTNYSAAVNRELTARLHSEKLVKTGKKNIKEGLIGLGVLFAIAAFVFALNNAGLIHNF